MPSTPMRNLLPFVLVALWSCQSSSLGDPGAPVLPGMGALQHPVSTTSAEAQAYFDQGLTLAYAFNHAEAERSFRAASILDPDCAMAWWGQALVLGPNLNSAMRPENAAPAWAALQRAIELSPGASGWERDYIQALAARYVENSPADRTRLDQSYANAMRLLARKYPDDADAQILFAEALMDLHPWQFWNGDGTPRPWTAEILRVLEGAMRRWPDHPGAIHFYIHAVEASRDPGRALAVADRLPDLVPGAGHLVHMPSHIYIRVGRYHEGSQSNQSAILADDAYAAACRQQGLYPLAYMPHNHHFLWATASLEGRSELALEAARNTAAAVDRDMMRADGMVMLQHYLMIPTYALVRFGRWEEILREPQPDADLIYPRVVWHYARGLAFNGLVRRAEAQRELQSLRQLAVDPSLDDLKIWGSNPTSALARIATLVLTAELATAAGDYQTSITELTAAIAIEDGLIYGEPPDWFFPVRQTLGAVLLEAGRPAEAERVYAEDLLKFPDNGWSLFGLRKSLLAQGKAQEAAVVMDRFRRAWQYSDVTLASSRF